MIIDEVSNNFSCSCVSYVRLSIILLFQVFNDLFFNFFATFLKYWIFHWYFRTSWTSDIKLLPQISLGGTGGNRTHVSQLHFDLCQDPTSFPSQHSMYQRQRQNLTCTGDRHVHLLASYFKR